MTTAPQQTITPPTTQAPSVSAAGAAHGTADSISSPVNGKSSIPPAVPTLGGPPIVNGNNAIGHSPTHRDHSRKSSITISAAGASGQMPNGGPIAGKPPSATAIQFGNMSPNIAQSTPDPQVGANSLSVSTPSNPRVPSPQTSPSPIPQPPASGGRPPPSFHGHGNGLNFGSLGGEEVARRGSMPQGSLTPNMQNAHLRRESTPTTHNEMNNGMMAQNGGRGGYPQQGGRGRGYPHQPYGQPMPYSPNNSYRGAPNAPRGGQNMQSPYAQGRGMAAGYAHSPHQGTRSPSLSTAQPIHPQAGQMPMPNPQVPQQPYYGGHMHQPGQYMNQPFDPSYAYYANQGYAMQPGMPMPQYMAQSPRPQYPNQNQQFILPYGQQQPQPMSRTPSGVSDRPPSTAGLPQPSMPTAPGHQSTTSRGTNSPGPKTNNNFQIPQRKSAGIVIKDPNSGAVKTFEKPTSSPAPSKSPANSVAASTPPPSSKSIPNVEPSHVRSDSQSVSTKTNDEKKLEMAAAVRQKIEEDKRRELEGKGQEAPAEAEDETAEEPKSEQTVVAPVTVDTEVADEPTAAERVKTPVPEPTPAAPEPKAAEPSAEVQPEEDEDSEEYWARIEAEEAAKEAEREAAYQKRRAVELEAKKKREAEENARAEDEMKKAEQAAEAAEEARLKKLAEAEPDDDQAEKRNAFASLSKSEHAFKATESAETPPVESGAATPVSEASSMGPPARGAIPKQKPAALKLETSKQVEPPQPSAALQSLRSARFLNTISSTTYPGSISSPNPALNSAAPKGKFRYDKEFLLQFQKVFVEKPSETWTDKVKETVGDTSETPASARGGRNMTGRAQSSRGSVLPSSGFGQVPFGSFGLPRTLPPGTTSEGRFEASNKQQPPRFGTNPPVGFVGGFASASAMTRTGSTNSMGHPQSPRNNPSRGGRGGSKGGKRESEKEAKTMPLTAGMDIKNLKVSEGGWKPPSLTQNSMAAGPPPGGDNYMTPDVVQRKVKSNLNKMTPTTFDKISNVILEIVQQSQKETDGRTLRQVIGLTFEKATDEAHWAQMYANFCSKMLSYVQNLQPEIRDDTLPLDKNGNVNSGGTLFRKYLLNRCQQDFEAGWQSKLPGEGEGQQKKEAIMLSEEYYKAAAAKRRGLGLVRFIGELYKLGMLTSRIMNMCVKKLVDYDGMPDEAEVESLASLLKTIGAMLDGEEKARPSMDAYFQRINDMVNLEGLPSRMRFMLMDIADMRRTGWKAQDSAKGPATIDEIRAQAAAAEREREARRAVDNARRGGGGGGRAQMGRGDARNFSNPMPPPQTNTVGMDDIRRLGRGGSRQPSQQGTISLGGPPSMFGARGSNSRKSMGGPGLLGRGGEDSGSSSRTGTPPARAAGDKDKKEEATSANAFSALASLGDSGEHNDHPGSPPSQANSPPVAKARPAAAAPAAPAESERSKSPLKAQE